MKKIFAAVLGILFISICFLTRYINNTVPEVENVEQVSVVLTSLNKEYDIILKSEENIRKIIEINKEYKENNSIIPQSYNTIGKIKYILKDGKEVNRVVKGREYFNDELQKILNSKEAKDVNINVYIE
jgi:predicted RND superfamily exporter protein